MKRGFAARRRNGGRFVLCASCRGILPLGQTIKILVSGQNFTPRGEIPVGFWKGPIKGCLQTFEDLSQKDTKVLP
mgnify:CR=1 FL=1